MRKQQVSDSTFPPLTAVALAQVTQHLHDMGRFLAAAYSNGQGRICSWSVSPLSPRPPLDTPQRKCCNEDIHAIAKKQLLQADALLPSKQEAGPSRLTQTAAAVAAAAVLSRSISSGRIEGNAGELHWTVWGGRYTSFNILCRHAKPSPPQLCMAQDLTCSARLSTAWHRQCDSLCVSTAWHIFSTACCSTASTVCHELCEHNMALCIT